MAVVFSLIGFFGLAALVAYILYKKCRGEDSEEAKLAKEERKREKAIRK